MKEETLIPTVSKYLKPFLCLGLPVVELDLGPSVLTKLCSIKSSRLRSDSYMIIMIIYVNLLHDVGTSKAQTEVFGGML